jgi:hypothetical protein
MMLICGNAISQTGITKNKISKSVNIYTDTISRRNLVCIDTIIAGKIANDLVKGDVCKIELELVKTNLDLTKKEVNEKDSIIIVQNKQKGILNLIISEKDDVISKEKEISKTFKKQVNKEKRTTLFYKFFSLLGVVATTLLVIKP